jgi:hypothetical protein
MIKRKRWKQANKEELKTALDERKYWKILENFLPWKLSGWSGKYFASFTTSSGTLELTGSQRNEILNAVDQG